MTDNEEYHTRWEEEHRKACTECYSDWYDEQQAMARDAELDEMMADEELAHELEIV